MAQPASNPKIEELRFRLKTDPKSRHFYPLAEELRKVGAFADAEQVLRAGLEHHATYLSAWVSLGRLLRDLGRNEEAVTIFLKALQLDRENVVVARLLGDTYLQLGEKVEAIKKYKLVHALLPKDEEIEAIIGQLERELNPPALVVPSPEHVAEVHADEPEPAAEDDPFSAPPSIQDDSEPSLGEARGPDAEEHPFSSGTDEDVPVTELSPATDAAFDAPEPFPSADIEPEVSAASPYAEPGGYGADAFAVEHPAGMSIVEPDPWLDEAGATAPLPSDAAGTASDPWPPVDESGPASEPLWATEEAAPKPSEPAIDPASTQEPSWSSASTDVWQTEAPPPAEELPKLSAVPEWPDPEPEVADPDGETWEQQMSHPAPDPWADSERAQEPEAGEASPFAEESDVFASTTVVEPEPAEEPFSGELEPGAITDTPAEDLTNTLTMGDLYARQGLSTEARHVYERVLEKEPENSVVQQKIADLDSAEAGDVAAVELKGVRQAKVVRLQQWLARVKQESGNV